MGDRSDELLREHESKGRRFQALGIDSFVLEEGSGEPVVCMHGVPASSFLYRKVLRELAARGLRGIAFDLPGLGLADRPADFDYSWTHLGRFALAAVDALGLDRYHLIVHDVGGPVGFELAAAAPARVLSLTVLNCPIRAHTFHRPWMMAPFATPVLDRIWLATARGPVFRALMRQNGVADRNATSDDELEVYVRLLHRSDGGRAFLKIMKGFELTPEKTKLYESIVGSRELGVQIVWGDRDPALTVEKFGAIAKEIAPNAPFHRLPGKHFFQEDQAGPLADLVARHIQEVRAKRG